MDENENTQQVEEMNDENDAREEDIVEDTDADTKDVVKNDDANYNALSERLSRMEDSLERLIGNVQALRDAQGIMVDNGATIVDNDDEFDLVGVDEYVTPAELDLTI